MDDTADEGQFGGAMLAGLQPTTARGCGGSGTVIVEIASVGVGSATGCTLRFPLPLTGFGFLGGASTIGALPASRFGLWAMPRRE